MKSKEIFGNLLFTEKFISKAACMSFPLVGNLSEKEGFWTSQNDRNSSSGCLFTYELFCNYSRFTLYEKKRT